MALEDILKRDDIPEDIKEEIRINITKQERVEKALKESEEIFNQFMNHSPVYVFFKDENTKAIKLSNNFEKWLGRPISELLGKNMNDLFPPDLVRRMVEDDLKVLKEDKIIEIEEELNGRFYSTIKFPVHRAGKPNYLAGFTRDITDNKQAEVSLQKVSKQLITLLDISYDLFEVKTYSEIGKSVFENIQKFRIDHTFGIKLAIYDSEKDEYTIVFNSGSKETKDVPESVFKVNSPISLKDLTNYSKFAIDQRKTVIINDNHCDFSLAIDEKQKNIIPHSMIFIPLLYHENLVGLVSFARSPINSFDKDFIGFLESISKYITIKIRELLVENKWKNAEAELQQSYKFLETKVNERTVELEVTNEALVREIDNKKIVEERLEALLKVASGLYSVKDYEDIGILIFSHLQKIQWANDFGGKLAIINKSIDLYKVVTIFEKNKKYRVPSDTNCKIDEVQFFSGYVIKTGKTLLIQDSHSEFAVKLDSRLLEHPAGSIIFIPLFHHDEMVGIFSIGTRPPHYISDDLLNFLESICKYVSIAIGELMARNKSEQSQKALKQSEEKYRLLFENNPQPIFVFEIESRKIIAVNEIAILMYGYTQEEFLKMNFDDLKVSNLSTQPMPVISTKIIDHDIKKHHKKDGSIIDIEIISHHLNFNNVQSCLSIVSDITERKIFESELIKAKEEAVTANKAKSEFLANMSHEIRTPMNAILGFADIVSTKISDPTLLNYLKIIRTSGDTLLSIINDILEISKIESGKYELHPKFINLKKILFDLHQIFHQKILDKGLKFLPEIDKELPDGLFLDEVRIRQIILNLISNSVKFTEFGYIKFELQYKYKNITENIIDLSIKVEDTGIGIPKDQLQRIFQPFEQADGQSTRRFGGTGLGLSIVQNLIKKIGGTISVESEVGKGTVFTVIIPNVEVITESNNKESITNEAISRYDFKHQKILVVDDIEFNRTLLKTYLDDLKINVTLTENGEEALALIKNEVFDLLIIDMRMPGISGIELAELLSQDVKYKSIPRIAYTASAFKEQEEEASQFFNGYLTKPIDKIQLIKELKRFLRYNEEKIEENYLIESNNGDNIVQTASIDIELKSKIIDLLKNKYISEWENVSKLIELNNILDFADNLKNIGMENGINVLVHYADELSNSAKMYKIKNTKNLLKSFPKIIEHINNI